MFSNDNVIKYQNSREQKTDAYSEFSVHKLCNCTLWKGMQHCDWTTATQLTFNI